MAYAALVGVDPAGLLEAEREDYLIRVAVVEKTIVLQAERDREKLVAAARLTSHEILRALAEAQVI